MTDFEKLGVFYLGREYDLGTKKSTENLVLYDSKDLVTHAVCVGMTGSGKTGLCIAILEEAAIDGIPAIVIDPKGDLANLLLTFPKLEPNDFAPWINQDDARRKGVAPEQYAAQQAELWRNGLASWGQDGNRIQRLRDSADFAVYTPGSSAGIPVSILKSFAAPAQEIRDDGELFRERIATTATSLLGLLGIDADPIQSREHILLSTLIGHAWQQGTDLDLAALIHHIQEPPVSRIGVLDVESFFPSKDRFALAMRLNNLLAAPGFSTWLEGEVLDVGSILYTPTGKPRIAIFSIAHLADAERMFFVSLLLNEVLGWMRQQPGTTSLRALVYMDEIFGYFPPTASPPSKQPLLTLMKQGRAFGVGVMLATQNPVDLDYKGLGNAGTWLIGRLQTDRDKQRLLDGLEGAASGSGARFDRGQMEETLAGLGNRVFLMNNVHEDAPVVFESRWAMSYLRGPLTRQQIKTLMDTRRTTTTTTTTTTAPSIAPAAPTDRSAKPQATSAPSAAPAARRTGSVSPSSRPVLGPDIVQRFLPVRTPGSIVYRPTLLACGSVYFSDAKAKVDQEQQICLLTAINDAIVAVEWAEAEEVNFTESDLDDQPTDGATFAPLPGAAAKAKSYDAWRKGFIDAIYRGRQLTVMRCGTLKLTSKAGESERDFRIRLTQLSHEQRDAAVEKLRQKYAPKAAVLEDRIRRAQHALEREHEQSSASKWQTAISLGSTVLGAVLGRKTVSAGTVGRATTTARGATRVYKETQDVNRAAENLAIAKRNREDLEAQFAEEVADITHACDPQAEELETITVKPKKTNITVRSLVLVWAPYGTSGGVEAPAW